jgi:hypothetical protein
MKMSAVVEQEPIVGELIVTAPKEIPIRFNVSDAKISELRSALTGLTATTKEGYEQVTKGIAVCRTLRGGVESCRKDLKKHALEYGRKVDAEAARLVSELEAIEQPLKLEKSKVDEAKEAEKRKIEQAKQAALEVRIQKLMAVECVPHSLIVEAWSDEQFATELEVATKAYESKKAKEAEQAAEAARIAAEQAEALRIEQEKLAAERDELERLRAAEIERQKLEAEKQAAEQAKIDEANRIEREAIESQRRALQAEKERLDREEIQRQEVARVQREAAEQVAREAELDRLAKVHAESEAKRIEALRPDAEKLQILADTLRLLSYPEMATNDGNLFLDGIFNQIQAIACQCEEFISE